MNGFDLVIVVLVVVAVVIGFRSGALPQLVGLAGALLGGGLALLLLPHLDGPIGSIQSPQLRAFVVLAAILFCVGIGEAVGSAVGRTAAAMLGEGVFGAMDRVFGGVVGGAQALLVVWLTGGLLAAGPQPDARQPGPDLARRPDAGQRTCRRRRSSRPSCRQMLDDTGLPDLFVGLEPLPAPPVTLPDDPLVQAARPRPRNPSTVKVTAGTCLSISSGTGFVVERGLRRHERPRRRRREHDPRRRRPTARSTTRSPVLYDPELDVALLCVPGLAAPPAPPRDDGPEPRRDRGDVRLPAAGRARRSSRRRSPDAYPPRAATSTATTTSADGSSSCGRGSSRATAAVRSCSRDGTVGGVVFAEARTDPEVGYALTPTSVRSAIAPALGRTGEVPVGNCIH